LDLKEQIYSVLAVSATDSFNRALPELFPASSFSPVVSVPDVSTAKRAVSERDFDFIVVNSPLPDDPGVRFAADSVSSGESVVLFLARSEQLPEVGDRLVSHGVFILQKPAPRSMFQTAVGWMISARERIRKAEKKTLSIEEKMKEIRIVNRAKWLLISELKMTEPDAHRFIEKQAMDRCVSKQQIAEEIIRTYG